MRDFKGMKRQRGRNRKPGGGNANAANPNRSGLHARPGRASPILERIEKVRLSGRQSQT